MHLIDSHTHLETFARKGPVALADTLARAREAGVGTLITIGTSSEDWTLYREIAAAYPAQVRHTVGLHPCSVDGNWRAEVAQIESHWAADVDVQPVGLGECGLDRFHLPKDDEAAADRIFAWQREAFAVQLEITRRLGCPLVVHSRGAFDESVAMIDASGVDWSRVVFHCFTEGPAQMNELMKRGARGSFTGVLTYKNAETVREAAKMQGLDRFMLETDAPYLTPAPHRGKPNEPAYLRHTAEYAAEVFGISPAELAAISTRNTRAFFGL